LGTRLAGVQLLDSVVCIVEIETVAARFFYADVEPDRRVEARLLGQHQVGEFIAEVFGVFGSFEVALLGAPAGDGVAHARNKLADAGFALRRAHFAVEILADDDIGGRLGPINGHFDVALLKDDRALIVADGGVAELPLHVIIRGLPTL